MATTSATKAASRDRMLDGIRGVAIVLVLLSHTWIVAPTSNWTAVTWLFSSGDFAVSIFFVVSGFLATRGMLREVDQTGRLRPGVLWLRRWIRISAQVYPLVIVVLALTSFNWNLMVAYQGQDTRTSAWKILTYTWNGYVRTHPFEARPDLGHLWYVCTDLWVIGLILLLVFLVGRWRPVLAVTLAATLLLVMVYREHVYQTEGVFNALIRVQTRADGLLWGALAAVALPWLEPLRRYARGAMVASTVLLVPLMGAVVDPADYFGLGGWLLNIDMVVFVLAVAMARPPRFLEETVGWRPLAVAGRYSLVLYIWHYPLFWYMAKNQTQWSWQTRTLVAYLLTFAIAVGAQVFIERTSRRWLRSEKWHALDRGFGPAILDLARRGWAEGWARVRGRHQEHPAAPRPQEFAPDEADDTTSRREGSGV
jgi:peptidoglycan/LPS O-acetylase OafA/YrhL